MDELIARLEAATEGSIELDGAIAKACGWKQFTSKSDVPPYHCALWNDETGKLRNHLPRFSTSLDAALGLVPRGFVEMKRYSDGWYVKVMESSTNPVQHEGTQKPAALAICIAALKALRALSHTAPQEK